MNYKKLILLRHGVTQYNLEQRMQGLIDIDLLDLGYIQAKTASKLLNDENNIVTIFSSDLKRAVHTADELSKLSGIEVKSNSLLRETDVGLWGGLTRDEVDTGWPDMREKWLRHADFSPPGGENRIQVAKRGRKFIESIMNLEEWKNGTTIVSVTHGGFIHALTPNLLNLPQSHWNIFFGINNTGWVELIFDEKNKEWFLSKWNQHILENTNLKNKSDSSALEVN